MNRLIDRESQQLQERMWIEIIESMEHLYAELADNQAEIERKNEELREAKEFIENVLDSMADTLVVINKSGIINRVNKITLELLGYRKEEIIGKPLEFILDKKGEIFRKKYLKEIMETGAVHNFEMNYCTREKEKIPMSFSCSLMKDKEGEIVGLIIVARDMRENRRLLQAAREAAKAERAKTRELKRAYKELKNLQTQLVHSEKLASVGRLAAGVAHEINNPLTGVLTFAHLLLQEIPQDDPRRKDVEVIVREAGRCRLITQSLLDFARQTEPKKTSTHINQLVEETLALVENQATFQNIKIIKDLSPSLPLLMADPNQIQQVFMNIILNAQEAMPQGGFLSISTDFSEDGKFLEIKFLDTGCGIPEENMGKLFDPFFTTKESGKGTGLGLAISYGIIKKHGGNIHISSKEGKGTTVCVKLPVKQGGGYGLRESSGCG